MKAKLPYQLSKREREAMNAEISRQTAAKLEEMACRIDSMVIYTLRVYAGWGEKKLHGYWKAFRSEFEKLVEQYEMPGEFAWLCDRELKKDGIDIDAWRDKEEKDNGK
jgi:hypothetical protein